MSRQRSHLKIGIRYIELQLGLLIGYGLIAAPSIPTAIAFSMIGIGLGYLLYKKTQEQMNDAASLALSNLFITLALIHWSLTEPNYWDFHIAFISVFLTTAYIPLRKLKFFSYQYKNYHIILIIIGVSLGYMHFGILLTWIAVNIISCVYMIKLMPRAFLVSILRLVLGTFFRAKIEGLENFTKHKKRIVIANHQSWLDSLILSAFLPTELTFAVNRFTAKKYFFSFFNFLNDHVSIDPAKPVALKTLIELVENHKTIVIFPEGRHTTTGAMMKIYDGPLLIAAKTDAYLLPVRIEGSQFSYLSPFKLGKKRIFPRITLKVLEPKKIDKTLDRTNYGVVFFDIMKDLMYHTTFVPKNLWKSLYDMYKKCGYNHIILEDYQHKPKKTGRFLLEAGCLGHQLSQTITDEWTALLLPNSIAFATTLFGLWSKGKKMVILNYSLSETALIETIKDLKVKHLVTAKKFIQHQKLDNLVEELEKLKVTVNYIDTLKISLKSKINGVLGLMGYSNKINPDSPAVALLSSGSEKKPKTIILSHRNIVAQIAQISTSIDFHTKDVIFNSLPTFHAFGLSIGLITPMMSGVRSFQYPNPLHYRLIPELIYGCDATILIGTNTFLREYAKCAHSYDFYNIRYVFAGGEKLQRSVLEEWINRFGIVIFEGYGTTETSPLISINNRMYHKIGTVGRPIPDIEIKIKKIPEIDEGGELLVRGPNIMLGYAKSIQPLVIDSSVNDWYATGDIVSQDDKGFLTIHGRKRRFAKISGEMLSLEAIEQIIGYHFPGYTNAIITVKDDKRGEKLILVTEDPNLSLKLIRSKIPKETLSNLMTPKEIIFEKDIPKLSTGKTNYPVLTKQIGVLRDK